VSARPVVYVAGAYTAATAYQREENIRRAERIALRLHCAGAAVLCVHTMSRFFWGSAPEATWIESGLDLLERCDAVCVVPEWEKSPGSCREVEHAQEMLIPIFSVRQCIALIADGSIVRRFAL